MLHVLHDIFGGDYPDQPLLVHQVAARAAVVYIVGLMIVRLGKSRLIARATALDVTLGFMLGSILARGITGDASISGTLVATATLVAIHWGITRIALHSHTFGQVVKGHAYQIIADGKVIEDNLRKSHISQHDLIEELRIRGVDSPEQVKSAYKERSGEISVIAKREPVVVPIAVAEGVQTVRIEICA